MDDLKKPSVKLALITLIQSLEDADSLSEVSQIKKLKGFSNAYRIRIGDYRVGIFVENDVIEFARIAHRKDIYNIFLNFSGHNIAAPSIKPFIPKFCHSCTLYNIVPSIAYIFVMFNQNNNCQPLKNIQP
ncbi:type II toxin-antitoxin system RelE family toxin [Dyadobacter pollutisoli]|uniref:Type II toxin-antitoxin system RelE/ParE family toxin n=1 Tax=Dyadobacter pollutisoli TaxID=2910158 RepID=A0A9E8SJB7_9BACT|nr:type II toxin-antitoxin system RelE/ParE family toxin [Dyadobacter pollutisoli]WAC09541.1 hypothetical protein ON006_17460 [Dyadobacter pollutisoli]